MVERLAERAGVDLSAAAAWLIVRLHEDPGADIAILCAEFDVPAEVGVRALAELSERGLVKVAAAGSGAAPTRSLTPEADQIVERLVAERRASLARLCNAGHRSKTPTWPNC